MRLKDCVFQLQVVRISIFGKYCARQKILNLKQPSKKTPGSVVKNVVLITKKVADRWNLTHRERGFPISLL